MHARMEFHQLECQYGLSCMLDGVCSMFTCSALDLCTNISAMGFFTTGVIS